MTSMRSLRLGVPSLATCQSVMTFWLVMIIEMLCWVTVVMMSCGV